MPESRDVDTHYIFVPGVQQPDELVFTGYKRNRITWKSKEDKWFLHDRSDLENPIGYHNITQETVLVGLHDWNLYPDAKSITQEEEKKALKFSKVLQNQYINSPFFCIIFVKYLYFIFYVFVFNFLSARRSNLLVMMEVA
jgi:hypothetical protein